MRLNKSHVTVDYLRRNGYSVGVKHFRRYDLPEDMETLRENADTVQELEDVLGRSQYDLENAASLLGMPVENFQALLEDMKIDLIHTATVPKSNLRFARPNGGITTVTLTTPDGKTSVGKSFCCFRDNFNKKLGVKIAIGRALTQLEETQQETAHAADDSFPTPRN